MRPEFDPTLNGGLDKLHRYHREAAADAVLQLNKDRNGVRQGWWSAVMQRVWQRLHRPSVPTVRH
ncbi:hypothetical protein DEDE109153_10395 [Deinococcus deserti]|uniref:Uncharacterized protein n=1 Tax=Deinococcus deserti (strain DSM 17065 / CIP 109153 / LMG 22923 / VCD115) TaxID=546414 RepID=X5H5D2_DEIDV|nr:hypothetical protein [Deinococcus deserti]AHX26485.1 hypothetical protein Deide_03508 [Deinococcus deserti VCD115]